MSSNARQQARRRERNLHRSFDVNFRLATDRQRLDDDIQALFRLHRLRWGDGTTDFGGKDAAFHRGFSRQAFERGWLRLWFLELDGVPVAAWHGFRFANVESYYQAGWDPAFARHSVASVLLGHTIRAAAEDRVDEYRLLRGDETYKYRYARNDDGLVSLVAANGANARRLTAVGLTTRRYARSARTIVLDGRKPRGRES
jgi:CelD/BcsL family acetyltransferase involved in cellulose biosynthesis